jgi:hypothetical protein
MECVFCHRPLSLLSWGSSRKSVGVADVFFIKDTCLSSSIHP